MHTGLLLQLRDRQAGYPTEVLIQLAGLYHTSTDYILGLTDDSAPPITRKA